MRAHEFIKENETITETPLPDDWDKTVFTPQQSYKKRLEYAIARAQKLGKGSSRTTVEIEYEGRQTALKVAHNKKGAAQNAAEASILDDGYVRQLGITIPIIDYDEQHAEPTWIHMEKAQKATEKTLCALLKTPSLNTLIDCAVYTMMGEDNDSIVEYVRTNFPNEDDVQTFLEFSDALMDLSHNFKLNLADFRRAANWGIYNGSPVLIDVGFTEEVKKKHY